jgi:dihydrofolate reductase
MIISIIAARDKNNLIGNQGKMPWHIPQELALFKKITMNKTLIMGRKTFEGIGRPLPGV